MVGGVWRGPVQAEGIHQSDIRAGLERFWVMELFLIFSIIALLVIVGNALLLLRTARKPKVPDSVTPKPYRDDEDDE